MKRARQLILLTVMIFFSYRSIAANMALYEQAKQYISEGRYGEAIKIYQSMVISDPTDSSSFLNLGICYYNDKQYQQAFTTLSQAQNEFDFKSNLSVLLYDAAIHIMRDFRTFTEAYSWAKNKGIEISKYQFLKTQDISFAYGFSGPLLFKQSNNDNRSNSQYYLYSYSYFNSFRDFIEQCKSAGSYDVVVNNPATFGESGFYLFKAFEEKSKHSYFKALNYLQMQQRRNGDNFFLQMILHNLATEACRYFLFRREFDDAKRALKYGELVLSEQKEIQRLSTEIAACERRQSTIKPLLDCQSYQDVGKVIKFGKPDQYAFLSALDIKYLHNFKVNLPLQLKREVTSFILNQTYVDYQNARNDLFGKNGRYEMHDALSKSEVYDFSRIQDEEIKVFRGECGFLLLKAFYAASRFDPDRAIRFFTEAYANAPSDSWLSETISANGIASVLAMISNEPSLTTTTIQAFVDNLPFSLRTHCAIEARAAQAKASLRKTNDKTYKLIADVEEYKKAKEYLKANGINAETFRFLNTKYISFSDDVYNRLGFDDILNKLKVRAAAPINFTLRPTKWYYADTTLYTSTFVGESGFYLRKAFSWQKEKNFVKSLYFFRKAMTAAQHHKYVEMFYYDGILQAIDSYLEDGETQKTLAAIKPYFADFSDDAILNFEILIHAAKGNIEPNIYSFRSYEKARNYLIKLNYKPDDFIHIDDASFKFRPLAFLNSDSCNFEVIQGIEKYFPDYSGTHFDEFIFLLSLQLNNSQIYKANHSNAQNVAILFSGESGFWLAKSFSAKQNHLYFSALQFLDTAKEKTRNNNAILSIYYNIAREATDYYLQKGEIDSVYELVNTGIIDLNRKANKRSASQGGGYSSFQTPPIQTVQTHLDTSRELQKNNPRAWLDNIKLLKRSYLTVNQAKLLLESFVQNCPEGPLQEEAKYELGACIYWDYYGLGKARYEKNEIKRYFKNLNLSIDSLSAKASYTLATLYRGSDSSAYYYEKVATGHPSSSLADDALFIIAYDEQEYLPSIPKYKRIVDNYPQGDKAESSYFHLGKLYNITGQYDLCIQTLDIYLQNLVHYLQRESKEPWIRKNIIQQLYFAALSQRNYSYMEHMITQLYSSGWTELAAELSLSLSSLYCFEQENFFKAKKVLALVPSCSWNEDMVNLADFTEHRDKYRYLTEVRGMSFTASSLEDKIELIRSIRNHRMPSHDSQQQELFWATRNIGILGAQDIDYWLAISLFRILGEAKCPADPTKPLSSEWQIPINELAAYSIAQYYRILGDKEKAISAYKNVLNSFPSSRLCDDSLIKLADLEPNKEKRMVYYKKLLYKYPNGDMAKTARDALQNSN